MHGKRQKKDVRQNGCVEWCGHDRRFARRPISAMDRKRTLARWPRTHEFKCRSDKMSSALDCA